MNGILRAVVVLLAGGLVLVASPGVAHAYLDAGTGSMIIQVVIGAVAAALATLKVYWAQIKAALTGQKRAPDESGDESG